MTDYIEGPLDFDPVPHLEKAFDEIKNYTAIFILGDGRVGSGTFVNACGYDGILTAHHVAEPVLNSSVFALCIAEHPHTLWLRSENFEHVPVGHVRNNPKPEDGPDL